MWSCKLVRLTVWATAFHYLMLVFSWFATCIIIFPIENDTNDELFWDSREWSWSMEVGVYSAWITVGTSDTIIHMLVSFSGKTKGGGLSSHFVIQTYTEDGISNLKCLSLVCSKTCLAQLNVKVCSRCKLVWSMFAHEFHVGTILCGVCDLCASEISDYTIKLCHGSALPPLLKS